MPRNTQAERQWPCHVCETGDQPFGTQVCPTCGHNLVEPMHVVDGRLIRACGVVVEA
jgi:rRNA maturation endonuclease Nob1